MKIAILHSFLDNIGGAEMVALTTARELHADIYTTNIDLDKIIKMGFEDVIPRIKSIGRVSIQAPFKQQMAWWRFFRLDLQNSYDLYIVTDDWAISSSKNNSPTLWYMHAPFNELWEYKGFIKNHLLSWWQKPLYEIWVQLNRNISKLHVRSIQWFVCNSKNSQTRAMKYYDLKPTIINPPIDTGKYSQGPSKGYWLSVNRLTRAKRIEIQLEAFSRLPDEKLIIVGCYEKGASHFEAYVSDLKARSPKNVIFLNWLEFNELRDLYSNCKGFVATAFDEDFGMTLVEAMASGKPVIASYEGGYKETINPGETGFLIEDINGDKLAEEILKLSRELEKNPSFYEEKCLKRSQEFDKEIFTRKIKDIFFKKINSND